MLPRTPALRAFGHSVRKTRESLHFSQEDLAEKADLDRTYISGIERGRRNPSLLSILRIAGALKTTCSDLTRGIEK